MGTVILIVLAYCALAVIVPLGLAAAISLRERNGR